MGDVWGCTMHVDPAYRDRGLKEQLVLLCSSGAEKAARKRLIWQVHAKNESALNLYRKFGFLENYMFRHILDII
ncbi:GNAT family N-acetyltransferase [Laceyella putida]|uniref:GNAT family N-acetyltransferase n=1 Tax=Laceyella putida TaxID=110101 RepID=UPI003638FAFD